jgi:hypothetical protein
MGDKIKYAMFAAVGAIYKKNIIHHASVLIYFLHYGSLVDLFRALRRFCVHKP